MRNRWLIAVLCATSVLTQTAHSGSAQQIRPQPRDEGFATSASNIIIPQSRSYITRPQAVAVKIVDISADVSIVQQVATTAMTVTLENPSSTQQEAEMVIPVTEGAAVRSFTITGDGKELTTKLLPRDEAKATYDAIVRKLKDPGLLEFAGYNLIRSSVFPIPPRGRQQVRVVYEHLLKADGARVDYVLPRSESFDSSSVPWKIHVRIQSKTPISTVYSPSHDIATEREANGRVHARLTSDQNVSPGAFRLSYLAENADLTASLLAYPDASVGGGYFLLLAGVPPITSERAQEIKREVTLVVDCSGSMEGEKFEQAKAAAVQVINGLNDGEAFNVVDFSDSVESFEARPVVKTPRTLADVRRYIDRMDVRGGTNINEALQTALRQPVTEGMLPIVLFLTDGLPTVGETRELSIRTNAVNANTYKRRVFTFGVGYDVNAPLLTALAQTTRAVETFVLPRENVEAKVGLVFRRLSGPVLADPHVDVLDAGGHITTRLVRDMLPEQPNDVFDGDQLVLLGKYTDDGPISFQIDGNYLGQKRTFKVDFNLKDATTRNAFIPRLWARRKIIRLIEEITQAGADGKTDVRTDPRLKELVDEIVKLSTEHGILTEYTAFLALEGTDLTRTDEVTIQAGANLSTRAQQSRSGIGSVNQQVNAGAQRATGAVSRSNTYYDANMQRVEITSVQQIQDRTFFRRNNRWVDARVVDRESTIKPDEVVEFGTPAFDRLVDRLVAEGRQGMLALSGELLLVVDGKTVLVKPPAK